MVRFRPLISSLCQRGVDFIILGGVAAVAQGSAYVTRDLDICYSCDTANLEKLAQALKPFSPRLRGAPENLPFALDVNTLRSGCNFTLATTAGDLDIFGEVPGLGDYEKVKEYSQSLEIEGFACRVLTLEGLILTKKVAGRSKDQLLLPELEALLALRKKQRPEEP